MCRTYLTQIKDLRLRLEGCENRTVTRLRQPVDTEPLKACALKTAEQMVMTREVFLTVFDGIAMRCVVFKTQQITFPSEFDCPAKTSAKPAPPPF